MKNATGHLPELGTGASTSHVSGRVVAKPEWDGGEREETSQLVRKGLLGMLVPLSLMGSTHP